MYHTVSNKVLSLGRRSIIVGDRDRRIGKGSERREREKKEGEGRWRERRRGKKGGRKRENVIKGPIIIFLYFFFPAFSESHTLSIMENPNIWPIVFS